MARILRGEIRWADLNPVRGHEQGGQRPVMIVSHNIFNAKSGTIIGVAITSKRQKVGFPLVLRLRDGCLPKESWVKISQIRTLSTDRIGKKIGMATEQEVQRVIEGLNEIVD